MISISSRLGRKVGRGQRLRIDAGTFAAAELDRRQVDGDADVVRPFAALEASLAQNLFADLDDQAHLLGDRNELRRRDHAAPGCGQRSSASQERSAVCGCRRRLVVQVEGLIRERVAQVELQAAARLRPRFHLGLEEAPSPAAVRLRPVERHVGVLQQLIGIDCRRAASAMPMLALDRDLVAVDLVGALEAFDDALGERGGLSGDVTGYCSTTNSSPPKRATTSVARTSGAGARRPRSAACRRGDARAYR